MLGLTLYLMGLLSGCNTSRNDPFIDLYRIPSSNYKHAIQSTANKKKVSVSFNNMPFLSFIRWFSDSTNFGVIFPPDLESKTITGEYKNATAAEIISTVARRFDLSVVYIGKTIYLGKLTKDDRGILVRKVKNFDSQSLSDALQIYLSESGKININATFGVCDELFFCKKAFFRIVFKIYGVHLKEGEGGIRLLYDGINRQTG